MSFPLLLNYPWALAALLGLFFIWQWNQKSVALLTPFRRRLSLGLRAAIFILAVLALTDPRWLGTRRETHVLWMVDVSRSVGEEAIKKAKAFAAEANLKGKIVSQSWSAFAEESVPLTDVEALGKIHPKDLGEESTDIAQALQFGDIIFPPGYAKTVVLFSDGVETKGDLAGQISRLRERGVRVDVVPIAGPDKPEILVRSVNAPRSVSEGEPVKITSEIFSNREGSAEVDLFANGVRIGSKKVEVKKGVNRFETTQVTGDSKLTEYSVAVRSEQDTVADNNQASAIVQSKGKSRALLLTDKPEQGRYLALALQQEGVMLEIRPAVGAPNDLADLQNYDLLILDNVAATDLTPEQMKLMAAYVKDFGGGFLMLGGDKSFGLGGYYQTPVEEVLPVQCDFEKEKENPSLGLVLVIDRSGSMSGVKIEMAKEAAKAAVELLSPQDFVGVVAFDNEAFWVAEMQSAGDKSGIQQKIASIEAGGGTNISPGMELAYSQLSTSPAKIKHVIVMTDGISTPGPFQELTSKMAQDRITVSTVGVGDDADQALLQQIAEWGNGRFYFTDNPQSIPQIFARETMTASKSAIQEAPFLAKPVQAADFLSGIAFESAPFLLGNVVTKVKPTADLWLATERNEPLLATWRYGLGQTGAFTSDARNRWAVEWLKWDGYGKFWVQVARKLKRPASLKNFPVQLQRERGGYHLKVDAVDENGNFLTDVEGEVSLVEPGGSARKLKLQRTAPGQLETFWPAMKRGAYHAQIVLRRGDQVLEQQYASATLGYPDEFLLQPVNEIMLKKLAGETGGKWDPAPATLMEGDERKAEVERELWPWLVGLALLFFVGDVGARRWPENISSRTSFSTFRRDDKVKTK